MRNDALCCSLSCLLQYSDRGNKAENAVVEIFKLQTNPYLKFQKSTVKFFITF